MTNPPKKQLNWELEIEKKPKNSLGMSGKGNNT